MNETCSGIIDPRIYAADLSSVIRFIHIGLWCIQYKATERPTIEMVVDILLGSSSIIIPVLKDPSERSSSIILPVSKEPSGLTNSDFNVVRRFIQDFGTGEIYQSDDDNVIDAR